MRRQCSGVGWIFAATSPSRRLRSALQGYERLVWVSEYRCPGSVPAAARSAAECSAAALSRTIHARRNSAPWRGGTVVGSGADGRLSWSFCAAFFSPCRWGGKWSPVSQLIHPSPPYTPLLTSPYTTVLASPYTPLYTPIHPMRLGNEMGRDIHLQVHYGGCFGPTQTYQI